MIEAEDLPDSVRNDEQNSKNIRKIKMTKQIRDKDDRGAKCQTEIKQ